MNEPQCSLLAVLSDPARPSHCSGGDKTLSPVYPAVMWSLLQFPRTHCFKLRLAALQRWIEGAYERRHWGVSKSFASVKRLPLQCVCQLCFCGNVDETVSNSSSNCDVCQSSQCLWPIKDMSCKHWKQVRKILFIKLIDYVNSSNLHLLPSYFRTTECGNPLKTHTLSLYEVVFFIYSTCFLYCQSAVWN